MYGPFSAAYAGNSIGAVMEITTRLPEKLEATVDQTQAVQRFSPDAEVLLLGYVWPGNVRELKNLIERLIILSTGETIDHVGFRLADHDGMRRKLDGLGIRYSRMELPELGERRLFIRTPTKILLELVFRDTKAASPSVHQIQNQ